MNVLTGVSRMGTWAAMTAAAAMLGACGGGDGDGAGDTPVALSCQTAAYQAGSVVAPTAEQLAAYAGRFDGQEGHYDDSFNFVATGTASLVLGTQGQLTYKDVAYTPTSVCIDKVAGPYGQLLYVLVGSSGHFDVAAQADADLGQAWGVSPVDGTTIFTRGLKR